MPASETTVDFEQMRSIERAMGLDLCDFVTAHRRVVPHSDAVFIEVADGVAAFTGVGSPLTTVKAAGPRVSPRDLDEIESFFGRHGVDNVTIELAPWPTDESVHTLQNRGYLPDGNEDVVAMTTSATSSLSESLHVEAIPAEAWPVVMHRVFELADESPTNALVAAAPELTDSRLYGIREKELWIAAAQSTLYGDVVIFGNDGTHPDARNRGAQTALIRARLRAIPPGKTVAAEVAPDSGSERNYLRCGFQVAYTRIHYVRRLR